MEYTKFLQPAQEDNRMKFLGTKQGWNNYTWHSEYEKYHISHKEHAAVFNKLSTQQEKPAILKTYARICL